jgi:hypothetical protein
MLEFYNTSTVVTDFKRSNYHVKLFVDDQPVNLDGICTNYLCPWEGLAAYLDMRTFKNGTQTLQQKCFSHLPIPGPSPVKPSQGVPWWLALVISIPLAVITIAVIKICLVMKEKKKKEREAKKTEEKAYAQLSE